MSAKYPPYVNAYGIIPKLFGKIKSAAVPPKFTYDFLKTVLGFKSSSAQATVPLLKRLGFLDAASVPTQAYKDYRQETESKIIMAQRIRDAYKDIYQTDEYAHKLESKELKDNLITVLGVEKTDSNVPAVVNTFIELVKLADFENKSKDVIAPKEEKPKFDENIKYPPNKNSVIEKTKLGISYTINLNLPPTTDIEVFNAIFKSLKENILD